MKDGHKCDFVNYYFVFAVASNFQISIHRHMATITVVSSIPIPNHITALITETNEDLEENSSRPFQAPEIPRASLMLDFNRAGITSPTHGPRAWYVTERLPVVMHDSWRRPPVDLLPPSSRSSLNGAEISQILIFAWWKAINWATFQLLRNLNLFGSYVEGKNAVQPRLFLNWDLDE